MTQIKKAFLLFTILLILFLTIALVDGYFFAPNRLRVREINLTSTKINPALDDFKILFFSDVAANSFYEEKRIVSLVTTIQELKPDVILFGGGLLTDRSQLALSEEQLIFIQEQLSKLDAPYGKFYVNSKLDETLQTIEQSILVHSEFENIDNKLIKLYKDNTFVNLIGVGADFEVTAEMIERLDVNHYTLAFGHQPNYADQLTSTLTDRYVAGYTFGGQINLPLFNSAYFKDQKYTKDHQQVKNLTVDISHGVGLTYLDMRVLSDPEINLYILQSKIVPQ